MKLVSMDTREQFKETVTIVFNVDDMQKLGITLNDYGRRRTSDAEIVKAVNHAFDMNQKATQIAIRDYQPAAIVRDAIAKLGAWLDDAANVSAGGLIPESEARP